MIFLCISLSQNSDIFGVKPVLTKNFYGAAAAPRPQARLESRRVISPPTRVVPSIVDRACSREPRITGVTQIPQDLKGKAPVVDLSAEDDEVQIVDADDDFMKDIKPLYTLHRDEGWPGIAKAGEKYMKLYSTNCWIGEGHRSDCLRPEPDERPDVPKRPLTQATRRARKHALL